MEERPSLYARPTVPRTAQALSELAVEEIAVIQDFKLRLAKKKADGDCVILDAAKPIQIIKAKYIKKTAV